MPFHSLFAQISKYIVLSKKDKEVLSRYFIIRDYPKNHKIIDLNESVNEWYFLNKGCVRLYYIKDNGEEVTGFFFTENMFFTSFESFLSGSKSNQVFQCLEQSQVLVINKNDFELLRSKIPALQEFTYKLLIERFIHAQKVVSSFILLSPEERYTNMFSLQPEILNRVPQHTLATFLGITPVSLSRIRKRILG